MTLIFHANLALRLTRACHPPRYGRNIAAGSARFSRESSMHKREIIASGENTRDDEKVRLGDGTAPAFAPARSNPHQTRDEGQVRLGDGSAPAFGPARFDPHKTRDDGKVRLGDSGSPTFGPAR
jgi:hypothetical protein